MFICEFCNKEFTTKGNLKNHQLKAKYCIQKRNINTDVKIEKKYKCDVCKKSFTSKQNLDKHEEKCNLNLEKDTIISSLKEENQTLKETLKEFQEKSDKKIRKLKQKNKNLKEKIEELHSQIATIAIEKSKKKTTINNTSVNITQIMIPMDLDNVLEIAINKLNENHFLDSQRGIARFFAEELLIADDGKMKMICTDTSRERFKYIDQEGNLKLDIQARDFIKKIYPPIYQVSEKIYNAIINRCKELNYLIESGKDKETDRTSVKIKEQAANNSWTEIRFIKSNDSNLNFRKELALRLCV